MATHPKCCVHWNCIEQLRDSNCILGKRPREDQVVHYGLAGRKDGKTMVPCIVPRSEEEGSYGMTVADRQVDPVTAGNNLGAITCFHDEKCRFLSTFNPRLKSQPVLLA
ncbi:unnamed protein product [Discosporangium mesarthrocarpum]